MLECSIITSGAEAEALADEWRKLHSAIGKSPFSGYDWFDIWWRTMGKRDRMLHIVTGRKDGKLVALLPLGVIRKKGFRILQATGAEAFYQADMLCEDPACAAKLWKAARASKLYDFAHIRDVCPGSLCEQSLSAFAILHDRNRAPYLKIEWKTSGEWLDSTPKERGLQRHTLKRKLRRLKDQGEVTCDLYRQLPLPDGMIEGMVEQKSAWCREHGLTGMFDQPEVLPFFRQFIEYLARSGALLFTRLKCGDRAIAYHLMVIDGKRIRNYVPTADYAWARYSPGHLSSVNAISWAIENGFEEYDQMHGDFAYKYQFSNHVRECREYTFSHSRYGWLGAKIFITRRNIRNLIKERRARKSG